MKKLVLMIALMTLLLIVFGCEKEKITESYIHETQIQGGLIDTIFVSDTIVQVDTVTVNNSGDTVVVIDTLVDIQYDTTIMIDTLNITDTINFVDTISQIDTVTISESTASVQHAFAAMQAYTDLIVIDDITQTVGYTDGWVFYLSLYMTNLDGPSPGIYDMYGYIDYWAPDWSDFYSYEYYWRMTYVSGDPSDPTNWDISEPPGAVGKNPGLNRTQKTPSALH